jgi:hypothetical protein
LRWYWSGVLGELYGGANETRFAMDMQDVVIWVDGGAEPRTVRDANFAPTRLLSLQSRLAAAYKGLAALLMKHGAATLSAAHPSTLTPTSTTRSTSTTSSRARGARSRKLSKDKWNSVINKAPLAAGTNRFISGDAPSIYLGRIQKTKAGAAAQSGRIPASHAIPVPALRGDDFDAFIRLRAGSLLDLIEQATGKAVSGRDVEDSVKAFGAPLSP